MKRHSARRDPLSQILRILTGLGAVLTMVVFLAVVGYMLIRGIPNITPALFSLEYTSDNCSMLPSIISTVIMVAMTLVIAVPLGVFSAIFLVEYAKRGSKLVKLVRLTSETLSGIPSIVYGLFGALLFVTALGLNLSLLSGVLTLAIMILPLIMRTTEEALLSVPDTYREGSFALGAGKLRTVFRVVLPPAVPGILSGVILAIGRIVGETAALMYTAGTVPDLPKGIFSSVRTLSVHMYSLSREGMHTDQAYATAAVLLVLVICINALSNFAAKRISKGKTGA